MADPYRLRGDTDKFIGTVDIGSGSTTSEAALLAVSLDNLKNNRQQLFTMKEIMQELKRINLQLSLITEVEFDSDKDRR